MTPGGLLALLLLVQVLTAPPRPPAPMEILNPCDTCVPGVENFGKVSDRLWRGAQPSAEGFRELERRGVRTIVSFREDHDDAPLLKGTKLRYLRIPSKAYRPETALLARFLKLLEDPDTGVVFIHCAQGRDRTGYNAAVYRMAVQGWTAEEAIAEMKAFRFNRIWIKNTGWLRDLDVDGLKAQVAAMPAVDLPPAS